MENAYEKRCVDDVSAGKSVGVITWRRCEGIGSRGHVVGWLERRFQFFWLSEGTEGEEGIFSSGCGWFEVLCVEMRTGCLLS